MAQSFADWENQLVDASVEGGVLGNTFTPEEWSQLKGHGLYANTQSQLLSKLGGDTYLQGLFAKGLTPEQILYGDTGKAYSGPALGTAGYTGDPMGGGPNSFGTALYNPGVYNDPNKTAYTPQYGVINYSGTHEDALDKLGDVAPYIIAAMMSMGIGGAIGAVGGAGAGLGSIGGSAFNQLLKTMFGQGKG
jgi:hypothetical protein